MAEWLLSGGRVENGLQGLGWDQGDQLGAAVLTQVQVDGDPFRAREGNEKWLDSGYISKRANKMCSQTGCGVRETERNRGRFQGLGHEPLSDGGSSNWAGEESGSKCVGRSGAWF